MYPFHVHLHKNTLIPDYIGIIEDENTIKASYFIEDQAVFENIKTLITPYSSYEDTGDDDYECTDEEHADSVFLYQIVNFCHELLKRYLKPIKKSKKEVFIHLVRGAGPRAALDYESIETLQDPIHIYLPSRLVMLLIKQREQRVYIEPELLLSPEVDLLLGLDFKMWPWRTDLSGDENSVISFWKRFLVYYRMTGLGRLIYLNEGVKTEANPRLLALGLEGQFQSLLELIENPFMDKKELDLFFRNQISRLLLFAPKMMLHAIGVQIEKYGVKRGEGLWKSFNNTRGISSFSFHADEFYFLYSVGRNMDLEDWYGNLMQPAFGRPPLLSKALVKKLHRGILSMGGRPQIWDKIQNCEGKDDIDRSLSLKPVSVGDKFTFEGIDFNFRLSHEERVEILLEEYA